MSWSRRIWHAQRAAISMTRRAGHTSAARPGLAGGMQTRLQVAEILSPLPIDEADVGRLLEELDDALAGVRDSDHD